MKKQKKIAFVHYSHYLQNSPLETMPFSLNSVLSLAKMGWEIDLYLWKKPSLNYKNLLPETVKIIHFRNTKNKYINRLKSVGFQFQFRLPKDYYCVFGVGQFGAYIANIIAKSNRCPFIYFNDEFPISLWGKGFWTSLEQQAVKNAAMVVVPDPQRFHPLCQELDVKEKPWAFLPNMPLLNLQFEQINWHEKLGIPIDSVIFLHAGYVGDWSQIPEILSSVPYWHKKAVLIIHSSNRELAKKYRQQIPHLELPGKVFWSYESFSESQINSLTSYVTGNFALYRSTDINTEYMGFSSGKLMRSLVGGSPVIASRKPSLSFVEDYQLGILVNHPFEIPAAVEEILQNREAYSARCLDFCQKEISFEQAWQKFCDQLKHTLNLDLWAPLN